MKKIYLLAHLILLFPFLSTSQKYGSKHALKVLKGFCEFVPSGNAVVDGDTVSVQAFYMSKTEMTNFDYLEFLAHLKKNKEWEKYEIAKVDSSKWKTSFDNAYLDPMVSTYHNHPAYHDYPVVNISKEGAEMYCEWLSWAYDSISGGELKLTFRIPTKAEYIRAARGDHHEYIYPWEGPYVRDTDGLFLANFVGNGSECITRNKETGKLEYIQAKYHQQAHYDGAVLTAQAKSFGPNEFGFYHISGNVAEMIADSDHAIGGSWYSPGYDIRIESVKDFNESHPTVGFRVVATYLVPEK